MATVIDIGSAADERLAPFRALTDADLRREIDEGDQIFIVEGVLAIRRALTSPYRVRSLLVSPSIWTRLSSELAEPTVDVFVASREVMAATAGFDVHRGALAVAERLPLSPVRDVVDGARCVVVLEGLNDAENLGSIARSAAALGADALVLDPTCTDPLYRRCVRVSVGEILHLPFTRATSWPDDLSILAAEGFSLLALTPSPDAMSIDDVEMPERVALILGAEGPGLSDAVLTASTPVRIPIRPRVDSLNVGHAAAIALHRLTRP
jgi:tRNA G18 (ribose-2'-O)-methylase SpoU